jgi:hypothetical protein
MIHTWTNFYAAAPVIMYIESFDGGNVWTHPTPLTPGSGIPAVTGEAGAVAPTGQFSMPFYGVDRDLWVGWAAIGGAAIAHGRLLGQQEGPQATAFEPAHLAVPLGDLGGTGCLQKTDFGIDTSDGANRGRLYAAWPQSGATGAGVFVSHSDDSITWSTPMEVTAELADDQFMSWIDVGPDGTVHVAYYDCSIDAGGQNMTMGYTYSLDGGETWSTNIHVGQVPFDGDLGHHQSGVPFIGDYNGLDASDKAVHFFWADTRYGRSDVYAATIIKSADDMLLYAPEIDDDEHEH